MRVKLPCLLWHENTFLEIDISDDWEVQVCPMRGADRPVLTAGQIEKAICGPSQSLPIRVAARGKKTAVIVFDDMTRPTRTYELAPVVISQLLEAGLVPENITLVCALGAHGALNRKDFCKKLGSQIVEKYRVFNHNPYENCVHVGTTSFGTPVLFNREVMEADFKIGIGCVTAHAQTGFSGGGKLFLPGVAHIDTISHNHIQVAARAPETTGLGKHENNILRQNIEEGAAMGGMDFKIEVIVNNRGATTAVFAGEPGAVHHQAVCLAKDVYAAEPRPSNNHIVIANAFAKANEMTIAVRVGAMALAGHSGTVVVIADSPEGQVVHYLLGRFGRTYGGRQYPITTIPDRIDLIIMAPHADKTFADWFSNPEKVVWTRNWEETRQILEAKYRAGTRAAVIPNATMQY